MLYLKQSTQIRVRVGPFVDATDGVTPETGITLGAADQAEALKADGAATVDISGATWAAVTGADGWYDLTLTTSHTDTVGELLVVVQDSSVCLGVHRTFQVVEEAIYDAYFGSGATGLLPANVTQISGDSTAADNLEADYDGTGYNKANSTIGTTTTNTDMRGTDSAYTGTPPTAAAIADQVWDEATAGHTTAGTFGEQVKTDIDAILADTAEIGAAGAGLTGVPWNAAWDAEVESEVTDALNAYDPPTKAEIDAGFAAQNDLDAAGIRTAVGLASANMDTQLSTIDGNVDAIKAVSDVIDESKPSGTASGTPTTTTMVSDIGVTVDDQFKGRLVRFKSDTTTAALQNQMTDITACTASSNTLTFTALTTAPVSGDTFEIV